MRHAFIKALSEEAKKNPKIILLTGDLGFRILDSFKEDFPRQFLNVGVAEADLISVAAGLASVGYIPFAYSIATFATMRPFEQIRNDVSLQKMNVKIVGVGAGLAYGKAGPTHHAVEDISIMRALPEMTIVNPSDKVDCYQATKKIIIHKKPTYLRIERDPVDYGVEYTKPSFRIGKGQLLRKGSEMAILTTGTKLTSALYICDKLKQKGLSPSVYSFPTIRPLDKNLLDKIIKKHKTIISLEEHRVDGGFGTMIAEFLSDFGKSNRLLRFGLKNSLPTVSADYQALLRYHRLSPEQVAGSILTKI